MANDPLMDIFKNIVGGNKDKDKPQAEPQPQSQDQSQGADWSNNQTQNSTFADAQGDSGGGEAVSSFSDAQGTTTESGDSGAYAAPPPPPAYEAPAPQNDEPAPSYHHHEEPAAPQPAESFPIFNTIAANPAQASNPDVETINGHSVGYAFLQYYRQHPDIGLPVDEQHGDVGGFQMFQNATLNWDGQQMRAEYNDGRQNHATQTQQQRTYTVESGDSLSAIAERYYGHAGQWHKIYEANRDQLSNPDLIYPGQVLKIPE